MTDSPSKRVYTSRIIKASGLLADTKSFFAFWDESKTPEQNFREARHANIFGKASRTRVEDILTIFRQRYCLNDSCDVALRRLVRSGVPAEIVDRVLYYYAALADSLMYDFVTEYLYDLHRRGRHVITSEDVLEFVAEAVAHGRTADPWESENTRSRVAKGLLATLRDFRILSGPRRSTKSKTLAPVHLPVEAFVFIAFHIRRDVLSGDRLLRHPHWQLFLLDVDAVERLFMEAHQLSHLRYEAAGSVVRVEFPYEDPVILVDALVERWRMWNR